MQPKRFFFSSLHVKPIIVALTLIRAQRWTFVFVLGLFLNPINLIGQRTCGADSVHAYMMGLPDFAKLHQEKIQSVQALLEQGNRDACDDPIIIPVAVHFQNVGIPMACAVDMALSQVETLNEDFAGTNPDIDEWFDLQPDIWPNIDNQESCISFCLATLNHPAGFGLSDGDYAVTMDDTNGDFDGAWSGYLNFFVRTIGGGTLGYSPLGGSGNGDGVTCDPAYFGSVSCGGNNISGPFNLGRTITHEVGHYLLLEHPWGGGGCSSTDDVSDTPVTDGPQFGCPSGQSIVNCTAPILWPSYMDYCDDACLFMFSAGQVDRMEAYVQSSLQNLLNTASTSCQETLCVGFDATITSTNESCTGSDGVITVNVSGGQSPYSYTCSPGPVGINGVFNGLTQGTYTLTVIDANGCEVQEQRNLSREAPDLTILNLAHEYCSDGTGAIHLVDNEPSVFQFSLNGGSTWSGSGLFEGLSAGTYQVTAANASGCEDVLALEVLNESDLSIRFAERNDVNCTWFDNGSVVAVADGAVAPFTFTLDGYQDASNGSFGQLSIGQHTIFVEDAAGCTAEVEFEINYNFAVIGEDCPCDVFVPNAITPDGDLVNEVLRVEASCPISDFYMEIFDRWGRLVFQTTDPDFQWHGSFEGGAEYQGYYVENNIYNYRLTYRWGTEEEASVATETQVGWLSILR